MHLRFGDDVFSAEALARLVPDYRDTDTWACGPAPMMQLIHEAYGESPRLRSEFFKLSTAVGAATGSAEGDVSFSRSGKARRQHRRLDPRAGRGARASTPEFGCRMGICFSCVSRKTEGTVRNVLTGEESALPDEDIRICVSAPVGDCAVDL